jgi:DNA-binding GntR family transcriptional regulator
MQGIVEENTEGAVGQIDRDSYEPAYLQLSNILRQKIAEGRFRPGEQIPSESELRSFYKVSQMTVRRAIGLLQEQGLVSTAQGKGSFVKPIRLGMFSFQLEELQRLFADKKKATIRLLEVDMVFPDEATASKLSVAPNERVMTIRRLILRDSTPALLHHEKLIYDPTRPLVESEMEVTSLEGLFSGNGHTDFKKGQLTVRAALVNEEESRFLSVPVLSPAFRLEHLFFDFQDRAVSWGEFLCRGDLLAFSTRVGIW